MRFISYSLLSLTALPLTFISLAASAQDLSPRTPKAPTPDDGKNSESDEEIDSEDDEEEMTVEETDSANSDEDEKSDESPPCLEGEDCFKEKTSDLPKSEPKKVNLDEDEDEDEPREAQPKVEPERQLDATDDREPVEGADSAKVEEATQAALTEAPPKEDSLLPVKFTTSTWSRFEIRENYDDIGISTARIQEGDRVVFRSRLGMRTNPLPVSDSSDVYVQFSPQATGQWGQDGTVGDASLGIYEGYVTLRTKRLDIQLGRMMMEYGDAAVIGNLDWNEKGRSFDGLRAHYKMDKGYFDIFGTQISEAYPGGTNKFQGGDIYFWGAYTGIGGYAGSGDEDIDLDLYFLGLTAMTGDELEDGNGGLLYQKGGTLFTMGSRARGGLGPVDIRAEAGVQLGHQPVTTSDADLAETLQAQGVFAYMGELDFGLPLGSKTRVSLGGIIASGDLPDTEGSGGWNELFPTGHKFLGLMDIIGARTNVASGNLKFSRSITKHLMFKADGHIFARLVDTATGQEDGLAGVEVDTQLIQKLGKYAYVRGLYGLFIPASGHYPSDDLVSYGEAQAGVTF